MILYLKPVAVNQMVTEEGAYCKFSITPVGEFGPIRWCTTHNLPYAELNVCLRTFDFDDECLFVEKLMEQ